MKRPNKEKYDFNDAIEGVRFGKDMIKYASYLESKIISSVNHKNTPKPIFAIGLSSFTDDCVLEETAQRLKRELKDYHTIVYVNSVDDIKLDCFFEKDFNHVKYEELKEIIKQSLK